MTVYDLSQAQELRFTILHTNDEHSHLIPIPTVDDAGNVQSTAMGGMARLAGAANQIREEKSLHNEPVLMFSGGDFLGGPAFGWLPLKDGVAAELYLIQKIGYDAITIGNHEFDYGPDVLANYLKAAGYPDESGNTAILGTNIQPPADHPLSELGIKTHYTKRLSNGLVVGIFGLIGDDAISKTAEPGPVDFADPFISAERAVEALKQEGVDIIISVNHSGVTEDRMLAERVSDIDVIVGGHSHTALYEPIIIGKTVIVQAGQYLNYLGVLELSWDPDEEIVTVRNQENERPFLKPLDSSVAIDQEIADQIDQYKQMLDEWVSDLTNGRIFDVRQVIAHSDFSIDRNRPQLESAIGNYVTDAMRFSAERVLGQKIDFATQANGAIRSDILQGSHDWNAGNVTFYDMMMAVGLGSGGDGKPGYPMVSFYITEDEVRSALEVSVLLSGLMGDNYFLQFSGLNMMYNPDRAVLLTVPFLGTPIPTSRAVLSAELVNDDENVRRLRKGGDELFHIVTDYYIAGFLPMVGERVPNLAIELKDESGNPIDLDDAIIMDGDNQLKVWQAVLEYTLSHQKNEDGLPVIPANYSEPEGRLSLIFTLPLWVWPIAAILLIVSVIVLIVKRR